MLLKTIPFVEEFVKELDLCLGRHNPQLRLTFSQRYWLSFCLSGILLTNSVCWARFERASLGKYTKSALSWMFRCSLIPWDSLLFLSVKLLLASYGITQGTLIIDDSDKKRSKNTTRLFSTYKVYDKSTAGYFNGQTLVFLLFVTPTVTFPVGVAFYQPDPALAHWRKEDERLKKLHIPKKCRPPLPQKNKAYPTKQEIAMNLLLRFREQYAEVKVQMVVADAFYGIDEFLEKSQGLFGTQVVSQVGTERKSYDENFTKRKNRVSSIFLEVKRRKKWSWNLKNI
jgi:hypothetical protein